ncbi:MAG: phosphoribosylanthranilate isomerase [Candidatus Altiarchaeota archaeon]|nr:phosphoribosylanthranilate isomerase [Candidatus Altiarchaeota archaeon]
MTKVKICGITNKEDALKAAAYGADAVGVVNIRGSPRYVDRKTAKEIFSSLPPFTSKIIVAIPQSVAEAQRLEETKAEYIQLHGVESYGFVRGIRENTNLGIIKKITPGRDSLEDAIKYLDYVDALLLDTHVEGILGGTGRVHDWGISKELRKKLKVPVILAGGLNPDNVKKAIDEVNPYGVDVSTGVEATLRRKDEKKMERFIHAAKNGTT